MRKIFEATILLAKKKRSVTPGYRPSLIVAGVKVFSNFDKLTPSPLPPDQRGVAVIRILWETQDDSAIYVGLPFLVLEGESEVGAGVITELLRDDLSDDCS